MSFPFFYRFFPLKFVELSVHSTDKHLLMLKLVNGRSYYLELSAPPDQQQYLFHLWLQLICLLKPPENTKNTEVNVKRKDFGMCYKKDPSPNGPPENVSITCANILYCVSSQRFVCFEGGPVLFIKIAGLL